MPLGSDAPAPGPQPQAGYTIEKRSRHWPVQGHLVCLTVYKRGAVEVVRRLGA